MLLFNTAEDQHTSTAVSVEPAIGGNLPKHPALENKHRNCNDSC